MGWDSGREAGRDARGVGELGREAARGGVALAGWVLPGRWPARRFAWGAKAGGCDACSGAAGTCWGAGETERVSIRQIGRAHV